VEESEKQVVKSSPFLGPVEKKSLVILVILLLASLYYRSLLISGSLLLGGVIALASFGMLRRSIESLLHRQEASSSALNTGFLILKYPLLLGLIAFLILKTPLNVAAWVVGFLSLVFAIILEGLMPSNRDIQ